MGLTRKLRKIGDSLIVAIPSQLAVLMGWAAGDQIEFDYLGDSLRLKKAKDLPKLEEFG